MKEALLESVSFGESEGISYVVTTLQWPGHYISKEISLPIGVDILFECLGIVAFREIQGCYLRRKEAERKGEVDSVWYGRPKHIVEKFRLDVW